MACQVLCEDDVRVYFCIETAKVQNGGKATLRMRGVFIGVHRSCLKRSELIGRDRVRCISSAAFFHDGVKRRECFRRSLINVIPEAHLSL